MVDPAAIDPNLAFGLQFTTGIRKPTSDQVGYYARAGADLNLEYVPLEAVGGVTDHGALTGLGDDDHAQYVHVDTARTITGRHTFTPRYYGAPFSLGATAIGHVVSGLNADQLDGQHGSYYTDLGNATGSLAFSKIDTSDGVDFGNSIKVVGSDRTLTLGPDAIYGSAGFTLKDSAGASRLEITTTGSNLTGIPRCMGDANNPIGMGDGGRWSAYFEDFRGVYNGTAYLFSGGLTPVYGGTGAAMSTQPSGATEMGVVRFGVGTTATGYSGLRVGAGAALAFGLGRNYIKTRVRPSNLSSTDEAFTMRLGWTDGVTGNAATDGAYFRYTDTENGGRWTCVCVSANTETTADSGVSVAANTWAKLEIEINAAATSAVFKIDGNTVATITTSIPSGANRVTGAGFWIVKSAGTSNRYMDLDYVQEVNEFTTPR